MADSTDSPKPKSPIMGTVLSVLMLTLIGAGTGLGVGAMLAPATQEEAVSATPALDAAQPDVHAATPSNKDEHEKAPAEHGDASGNNAEDVLAAFEVPAPVTVTEPMLVVPMEPIVTNLAAPAGVWLRVEASLLASKERTHAPAALAQEMATALLAYIRTLKLSDIEGNSGFLAFRDDLDDVVRFLSHGTAERVLIRSLVVE